MIDRLPVRAITVGAIALVIWWVWAAPGDSSSEGVTSTDAAVGEARQASSATLQSAVKPISLSNAAVTTPTSSISAVNADQGRFDRARQLSANGDTEAAMGIYREMIGANANAVGPYINLAALYAQNEQLDMAQRTLTQGLNADENYATLFASLQKVLGALAANAYQDALEKEGEKIAAVQLPQVDSLISSANNGAELLALQQQIERLQASASSAQTAEAQATASQARIQELEAELLSAQQSSSQGQMQIDELQQALASANQNVSVDRSRVQNLIADLASAKRDTSAGQQKVDSLQAELTGARETSSLDQAKIEKLETELAVINEDIAADRSRMAELQVQLEAANEKATKDAATLEVLETRLSSSKDALEFERANYKKLETELADARVAIDQLNVSHQQEVATLKAQLAEQRLAASDERNRAEEQARLAAAREAQLKAEQEQIALQKQREEDQRRQELLALREQQQEQQRTQQAAAAASEQSRDSEAIDLVNSWADAWSRQAVSDYVGHYAENYSPPGSGLSHQQWRDQRQVRLTNKSFIKVTVSEFSVRPSDRGFDVTFTQRYQANSMDGTIRKRLRFAANGENWRAAKIIGEQVIR